MYEFPNERTEVSVTKKDQLEDRLWELMQNVEMGTATPEDAELAESLLADINNLRQKLSYAPWKSLNDFAGSRELDAEDIKRAA